MLELKIKKFAGTEDLPLPKYMSEHAAGMDVYAAVKEDVVLGSGETKLIPTGMSMEVPNGYEVQVRPRSGLALKHSISLMNSPGTIDADYRGELGIILSNFGKEDFIVKRGERVAQIIVAPVVQVKVVQVEEVSETERGAGGFGSTGGHTKLVEETVK
jgi:dUTP diphosphatase